VGFTVREAYPFDADTLTARILLLEKICGRELLCRLQGPGSVRSRCPFVNYRESGLSTSCRRWLFRAAGSCTTCPPASLFQPLFLHNLLCRFELSSVFQRSRTAQGPAV